MGAGWWLPDFKKKTTLPKVKQMCEASLLWEHTHEHTCPRRPEASDATVLEAWAVVSLLGVLRIELMSSARTEDLCTLS